MMISTSSLRENRGGETGLRRVFVVDDHPIVRHGLELLINREADLAVCGEAGDADEALKEILSRKPDVVLVDIALGATSGISLTENIRRLDKELPVLVLSMHEETSYAERAVAAGANGYVMKQEAPETVIDAIREVLGGGFYLSEKMSSRALADWVRDVRRRRTQAEAVA
jgi:DNA-binding NarL/FixJ family response regulator